MSELPIDHLTKEQLENIIQQIADGDVNQVGVFVTRGKRKPIYFGLSRTKIVRFLEDVSKKTFPASV